jgi:hypothetical protein
VNYTRFLSFVFLLLVFQKAEAQTEMMDTLRSSLHHSPRPLAGFGGRNAFVQNSRADIWGIKIGLSFNKRVRIGIGYNYMSSDLTQPFSFTDKSGITQAVLMHMKLRYVSAYFEYVYFKNKHWEFSMPLQIGLGNSLYEYTFENRTWKRDNEPIVLYEPMVETEYFILPWLGLEADVGLRLMLKNNRAIGKEFNSPMYAFGAFIAWDELYKAIFPHSSLARKM